MDSRTVALVLAAALAGCSAAPKAPPRAGTAPAPEAQAEVWGTSVNGLRMRARAPSSAARGDWIEVEVDTVVDVARLPEGTRTIDARGAWYFARLRLTPVAGGGDIVVRCLDPSAGMPDPPLPPDVPGPRSEDGYVLAALALADAPVSGRVTFPLSVAWEKARAGEYRAVVELAVDESAHSHAAVGDWQGVVVSQPFTLRLTPAPAVFQDVELPSEAVGGDPGATVTLRLRVRNGFVLGLRGDSVQGGGGPGTDFADLVRQFVVPGSGEWLILETSYGPEHLWHPSPGRDHYRVLWRGACPPVK